jgi:outer membrane lipoprotein-sorting protein
MKKIILWISLFGIGLAQTGIEIAQMVEDRISPKDMISSTTMVLTNKKGRTRTAKIFTKSMDDSKKQIMWFLSPKDDKGVAFLKIEHDDKDDEMRMWLPAFKKIRRISSKKKGDSFMGSDLTYEDMSSRVIYENTFSRLEDEKVGEIDCFVIEAVPNPELKSSYSKHKTWIDKKLNMAVKEESYDRMGDLKKIKTFENKIVGKYRVMSGIFVNDVQNNHTTNLTFDDLELDTGIKNNLFHEKNLKRLPRN